MKKTKIIIVGISIDLLLVPPLLKYALMDSYSQKEKTITNIQNTICSIVVMLDG